MFSIYSNFFPFRLKSSKKDPVLMSVTISNQSNKAKKVTFELALGPHLSLDKGGLKGGEEKRFDAWAAGETKTFTYDVYPRFTITPGEHSVRITVLEHFNDYKYVEKKYSKTVGLMVDK
ncbi:MAG: hypothetical protein HY917_00295 [Candidatus Diapherotrites archaeon]|nr:hypothetical protein [Candidatus Diapherotrites archaeon]